jgi:hypothetical protein
MGVIIMGSLDMLELLNGKKKDEIQYFVWQHKHMWIVEDSKGRSAMGNTRDEATKNFLELMDREYAALKEKVDRDTEESTRKHRELWGY